MVGLGWAIYSGPGRRARWRHYLAVQRQASTSGGRSPEPALIYQPNDDWDFRIFGDLFYTSFRTDDVLTTEQKLQLHNAVVQYSEDRAGVQVELFWLQTLEVHCSEAASQSRRDFDFFRAEASAKTNPASGSSTSESPRTILGKHFAELSRHSLVAANL